MSKKIVWKVAPLQRVVGELITDPAEQAAIDRARKRANFGCTRATVSRLQYFRKAGT